MRRACLAFSLLALAGPAVAGPGEPAAVDTRAGSAAVGSPAALRVHPARLRLDGGDDRARVLVQLERADGSTADVSSAARLELVGEPVARLEGTTLLALRDGAARLRVAHGELSAEVPLEVRQADRRRAPSFENDVLPLLTRAGCNSGSCHGSARGRDGFHLSLFGYDPAGDHWRVTAELPGRRIEPAAPGESLLVRKATGAVRHTGGRRLEPASDEVETLVAWIRAGAPPDPRDLPRLVELELWPPRTVLVAAAGPEAPARQPLAARALYADGSDRDVTGLAAFASSDPAVASLESGVVVARGRGQAWVTARFGDRVVAAEVLVVEDDPGFAWPADEPEDHPLDRLVNARLRRLRARPAPLCDDATFLRRVTLDLTGQLPTPEEVLAFLADAQPGKRARVVDELLGRPAFAQLLTMLLAERLLVRSDENRQSPKATQAYARWLAGQIQAGAPLDRLARQVLTASGGSFERPETGFYAAETETETLAEDVAQAFLGLRLQCARCHNHPFDRWTQDDYHGFAAFFAQVGRKPGADPRERVIFDRGAGELQHPVKKQPVAPRFLGGQAPPTAGRDRREVLAGWLTAPDNPWFARNLANLLWAHLFGAGIVDPPDDARVGNPPRDPALLDALAARLVEDGFDARKLVRWIATSRAYQRGSEPGDPRVGDPRVGDPRDHARAQVRRLRAEVLLDAISFATDAPDDLPGLPRGARAVELPDGSASTPFLTTFGRSTRETPCSCEVRVAPNLGQALHLLVGDTIEQKLRRGKLVPRLVKSLRDPLQVARALWLRTLSRPPRPEELAALEPRLAGADPIPVLEDLLWALLNSREFLFQH